MYASCRRVWSSYVMLLAAVASATALETDEQRIAVAELAKQVAEQKQLLEQQEQKMELMMERMARMETKIGTQAEQLALLSGPRGSALAAAPTSAVPGAQPQARRLSVASATNRSMWSQAVHHVFEDPSSSGCDLHSELHSASTGPLNIKRAASGQLSMTYGASVAFSVDAPFTMTHAAGCASATIDIPHALTIGGVAIPTMASVEAAVAQVRSQAGLGFDRGAGFSSKDTYNLRWGIRPYGLDKWMAANNGEVVGPLSAGFDSLGGWEKWRIERVRSGDREGTHSNYFYAIWSDHGTLLAASSSTSVIHSGSNVGGWERWSIYEPIVDKDGKPWGEWVEENFASYLAGAPYTGGAVALYNKDQNCFLQFNRNDDTYTCSSVTGAWETFEFFATAHN